MKDLYELLQVSRNASPEVIKKAYKTLAKKHHPDIAKDKEEAEKMMKRLNSAYEILSNPKTREEYDYNLEQEEKEKNNNVNNTENTTSKYNEYYNVQKEKEENNMYYNHYDEEKDYANNLNLFKRVLNVHLDKNTKIILVILLGIILLLIINFFSAISNMFNSNKKIENPSSNAPEIVIDNPKQDKPEEYPIDDMTPVYLIEGFFQDLKQYKFEEINSYLTENTKISEKNINTLNTDKIIYEYIISNSNYKIVDYKITNKKAEIEVQVDRFDVENALLEYRLEKLENFEFGTNEEEVEIVYNLLKQNVNQKVSKTIFFIVDNIENEWKINLTSYTVFEILGTSIL